MTTTLAPHPLAESIPAMFDREYIELRDDIQTNGLREPITLYEGKILDGRHRARACWELGVEPLTREYEGDEPAAYVLSLNVRRRNLSPSQRAAIAVEFLPWLEEEAKRRQGEHLRTSRDATGRAQSGSKEPDWGRSPQRAATEAGALVGVSASSVKRAKRVKEQAPEEYERVKAGETPVGAADTRLRENGRSPSPGSPIPEPTGRERQRADKAKLRIEKAVGACSGLARGLDGLNPTAALTVTTPEERAGWISAFRDATAAIHRLKKRLEEPT